MLSEDILKKDNLSHLYDLGDFYKNFVFSDEEIPFKYDLVSNILYIKLASINNIDSLGFDTLDDKINYTLQHPALTLKAPMVTGDE